MYQFKPGTFIIVPNKHKLSDLSMKAIVTWISLCAYADDDGVCYPAKKTLGELVGIGESSVERSLKELVQKGWIKVKHRKNQDGGLSSNVYTLYLL